LLTVQTPKTGYGSGLGLALDLEEEGNWGSIQRVHKLPDGNGYILQTKLTAANGQMHEEYHFEPREARWGRIGLRREKKELVFLAADNTAEPLVEIKRLPFTDRTIRVVRFFADPGGSPTALDVRVRDVSVRAEEITGGVPERDRQGSSWWWLWGLPVVGGVGFWYWRVRRRSADSD
jgi:hypothetical protein